MNVERYRNKINQFIPQLKELLLKTRGFSKTVQLEIALVVHWRFWTRFFLVVASLVLWPESLARIVWFKAYDLYSVGFSWSLRFTLTSPKLTRDWEPTLWLYHRNTPTLFWKNNSVPPKPWRPYTGCVLSSKLLNIYIISW